MTASPAIDPTTAPAIHALLLDFLGSEVGSAEAVEPVEVADVVSEDVASAMPLSLEVLPAKVLLVSKDVTVSLRAC